MTESQNTFDKAKEIWKTRFEGLPPDERDKQIKAWMARMEREDTERKIWKSLREGENGYRDVKIKGSDVYDDINDLFGGCVNGSTCLIL